MVYLEIEGGVNWHDGKCFEIVGVRVIQEESRREKMQGRQTKAVCSEINDLH